MAPEPKQPMPESEEFFMSAEPCQSREPCESFMVTLPESGDWIESGWAGIKLAQKRLRMRWHAGICTHYARNSAYARGMTRIPEKCTGQRDYRCTGHARRIFPSSQGAHGMDIEDTLDFPQDVKADQDNFEQICIR